MSIVLLSHIGSSIVDLTAAWFCSSLVVITSGTIHICLRFDNVENLIIADIITFGRSQLIRIFIFIWSSINSNCFQFTHTS